MKPAMKSIKLFKDGGQYKDDLFVCVNGRAFQIKRGVFVDVPACVAAVIDNQRKQEAYTAKLLEKLEQI